MKNEIRLHVRGQLGVQILQSFVALGSIYDDEKPVIYVNTHGVGDNFGPRLNEVFDLGLDVRTQDEMRKTPYWVEGAAGRAFRYRERTLTKWLKPIEKLRGSPQTKLLQKIVHVRGSDKSIASVESYARLWSMWKDANPTDDIPPLVVGTPDAFVESVATAIKAPARRSAEPFMDWYDILNADVVVCMPNAFVISTLMVNPNKRVAFGGKSFNDGSYPIVGDMTFIEEARQFCGNVMVL